jgi:hypothetical protein
MEIILIHAILCYALYKATMGNVYCYANLYNLSL